jgi:N-hydroxyarylamine O-acetyltransferase
VPFDNVRKLIHLRRQDSSPLPGNNVGDFFEAWLRHGTGGTCWAGDDALHALLNSLGFAPIRGLAMMLVTPNLPPNHGTVLVGCEGKRYIVDASILHGEPLQLDEYGPAAITHPAWGVQSSVRDGQWTIHCRPLHKPDGLDCRIDRLDVTAEPPEMDDLAAEEAFGAIFCNSGRIEITCCPFASRYTYNRTPPRQRLPECTTM